MTKELTLYFSNGQGTVWGKLYESKIGITLIHRRYFLTILFKNAGVATQNQLLTLNFANTVVSAVGALIGTSLTDKGQFSSLLV